MNLEKVYGMVTDDEGYLSLSKLACAMGHLIIAVLFVRQQWHGQFSEAQWMIYIGATILHAGYDRTVDTFKALRQQGPSPTPSKPAET